MLSIAKYYQEKLGYYNFLMTNVDKRTIQNMRLTNISPEVT